MRRITLFWVCLTAWLALPAVLASERDVHFHEVYVLLRLSGVAEDEALRIARASQSVDENAETSPLPEKAMKDVKDAPWWYERTSIWHSLPPRRSLRLISGDLVNLSQSDRQYVDRRLVELYARAKAEPDRAKAQVFFGQYLHALVDSITHDGYNSILGHAPTLHGGHAPDIPGPSNKESAQKIARLVTGEVARFQREKLQETPAKISAQKLDAVVSALTYSAPSDDERIEKREEVARQRMEQNLKKAGVPIAVPKWTSEMAIPFDVRGEERSGPVNSPGEIPSLSGLAKATSNVAKSLAPLGIADPSLGGIDLRNVRLDYLTEVEEENGQRSVGFGLEPDPSGKGSDAELAFSSFAAGIRLPEKVWWVNLNPNEPHRIIDAQLGAVDAGRVMLEADFLLKLLIDEASDPARPEGKAYWAEVFAQKKGTFSSNEVVRVWIVPGECKARVADREIELVDCPLSVRMVLENFVVDALVDAADQAALKSATQALWDKHLVPYLNKAVNVDPRFAELRTVYRSRALAQAYKEHFGNDGALAKLIDKRGTSDFPPSSRRTPQEIWQEMVTSFNAAASQRTVDSPIPGDLRRIKTRLGGIVFDDVAFGNASEVQVRLRPSPSSPKRGLLLSAPMPATTRPPSALVACALSAFGAMPKDAEFVAAIELLPALALAKRPEFDSVRKKLESSKEAAFWIRIADGIRTGAENPDPGTDLFSFSIWTRREPKKAAALLLAKKLSHLRFFTYAVATLGSPRAADPDPSKLTSALVAIGSKMPAKQKAQLLTFLAVLSANIAPRAIDGFVDAILKTGFPDVTETADDMITSLEPMVYASNGAALKLLDGIEDALKKEGFDQVPEIRAARERWLNATIFEVKLSQNLELPRARSKYASLRFLAGDMPAALENASKATDKVAAEDASPTRDDVLRYALPVLAWGDFSKAERLAPTIKDPMMRMLTCSKLASHEADPASAALLLSRQIALDYKDWVGRTE